MSDSTIQLLKDLIAIDSVNPSLVPGGAGEREVAERIAQEMRSFGMDAEIRDAAPGRPNVVGVLESGTKGRTLMLCGHSDTVGVDGMTAPFDPVERDGRIYGRGAQDMKGGVASILGAVRKLAESNALARGRVVVAIVADEEFASIGASVLAKEWIADAAVITEPTDLTIGLGQKGFEWVEVTTEGVAAHGSRPDAGVDAIAMMGRVLAGVEQLQQKFTDGKAHPLLGRPSVHASLIEGGRELSTYPDRCVLSVERRTVAGEEQEIFLREVESILDGLRKADDKFRASARFLLHRSPYVAPEDHALPKLLADGLRPRKANTGAMSFWTDAAILGSAGIASVVFGPGGSGLHGLEEHVRIDEVLACCDALLYAASAFC
ncbi:MAG TPA: ArgE/DapE family deacylase [Thermoanaerobaculia bacterium]|nr:ArgE/DapE family deacylase [Thermoanaerobaculia bacterium]